MATTTTTEFRLDATKRETTGTNATHAIRNEARVPGVIYGHGAAPVAISFDRKAFEDLILAGGRRHMITVTIDGASETALIRDVQSAHVGRQIRHVDLLRVAANENVTTTVPVVPVGVPTGVKNDGGVLDVVLHDVTISGPAAELPDHVDIDVSNLGVHDHITAADVTLPEHVHMDSAPDTLLASVEASKTAEIVAADEVAAVEAAIEAAPDAADPVAETPAAEGDASTSGEPAEGAP